MKSVLSCLALIGVFLFTNPTLAADAPENVEGAETISVEEAKQLHDKGVMFIDLRQGDDFEKGHIPDAEHVELTSGFNQDGLEMLAEKDETIVFYCYGVKCLRSSMASKSALKWGFKNIKYFRTGMPAWRDAGYPVEKIM